MRTSVLVAASAGAIITGVLGKNPSDFSAAHRSPKKKRDEHAFIEHKLTYLIQIAYAAYFDHKRQTDPDFRKSLKRNNKRLAKAVKEEAEAHGAQQREVIKQAVQAAKDEGFPTDLEEKESYFMSQVAKGEGLCQEGTYHELSCERVETEPWQSHGKVTTKSQLAMAGVAPMAMLFLLYTIDAN